VTEWGFLADDYPAGKSSHGSYGEMLLFLINLLADVHSCFLSGLRRIVTWFGKEMPSCGHNGIYGCRSVEC
jgi:hypothetical protein